MTVTKSDAPVQSLEKSEQTDVDLEKQDKSTQDIEHVTVKDDPRIWSSKGKACLAMGAIESKILTNYHTRLLF